MEPRIIENDKDFLKELSNYIAKLEKIQFLHLGVLFIIVIAIPLTLYVTRQRQDIQQHAQTIDAPTVTNTLTPTPLPVNRYR